MHTADDLGDALQLPANFASFLEWPEDATDEWSNAQHLPVPLSHGLSNAPRVRVTSSIQLLLWNPDPNLPLPHLLGLQPPVEPDPNALLYQMPSSSHMNGSRPTLER